MKSMYFALLLLLCSCGQGIPDYNNLGAGFYLDRSDNGTLQFFFPDSVGVLIEPIYNVKFNNKYITLCEGNTIRCPDSTYYHLHHKVAEDSNDRLSKYNDTIPNLKNLSNPEVFYNYYFIIYKCPVKVYGPYIRKEFREAMKILNIPDSLRVDY